MALTETPRGATPRVDSSAATSVLAGTAAIWASGILLRLLLAPFTWHVDLYQIYSRAAEAAYHGQWFTWGSQIVIQTIHDVWLLLVRPFLPGGGDIWSWTASRMGLGAQGTDIDRFLAYAYLPRALLLLKLPYILSDVGTGFVLTRLVEPARRRRVLALWLLNPLAIFASAVFGRHDSIAILLVVLSVLAAQRGRRVAGLVLLGIGALARFFPAFLAPFFVVAYRRSRRELVMLAAGLAGVWLAVEVAAWAVTGASPTLTLLNRYPHVDFLVQLALPLGDSDRIFIFPLVYGVLWLWFFDRRPAGTEDYVAAGAALFLILFALTFFHPQYTVWLVPLLALRIDQDTRLIAYHMLQVMLLALYSLKWGVGTTWGLLAPLGAPLIQQLPDPLSMVGAQISTDLYLGLTRTLFAAVSVWIAYRLLRDRFAGRDDRGIGSAEQEVADDTA